MSSEHADVYDEYIHEKDVENEEDSGRYYTRQIKGVFSFNSSIES